MKFLLLFCFAPLAGCGHFSGLKRPGPGPGAKPGAENAAGAPESRAGLKDYIGVWKLEKEIHGCFPIKIEKGPSKGMLKITREPLSRAVAVDSHFGAPPQTTIISDHYKYKLASSSLYKFIRGQIVSAAIWSPDTNDWLSAGLSAWILDKEKGVLVKKKAGLSMQKSKPFPKETAARVFKLQGDDVILKWDVECRYVKSAAAAPTIKQE